jgi:ribosomal protein S20
MKKLIAAATVAGLVVLGGGAVASADPAPSAKETPTQSQGIGHGRRKAFAHQALGVAADTIGISRAQLVTELRAGKTVAQVAQSKGVETQAVTAALVGHATARIDAAVKNGAIDADRAAKLEARLPQLADKLVNKVFDGKLGQGKGTRRARVVAAVKVAADTIGIEPRELVKEVRSGKTVADVARSKGVEPQAVIDAVVAKAQARIDAAVERGRIDADRGAELTKKVTERVTELVNATPHRSA